MNTLTLTSNNATTKATKETEYTIIGYYYAWFENGPEDEDGEIDPFQESWYISLIGVNKNKKIPPITIDFKLDMDVSGGDRTYPSEFDGIKVDPLKDPLARIVKDDSFIGFKKSERFSLDIDGIENREIIINHRRLRMDTKEVTLWVPTWIR